jgi:hypothetical protein
LHGTPSHLLKTVAAAPAEPHFNLDPTPSIDARRDQAKLRCDKARSARSGATNDRSLSRRPFDATNPTFPLPPTYVVGMPQTELAAADDKIWSDEIVVLLRQKTIRITNATFAYAFGRRSWKFINNGTPLGANIFPI